MPKSETKEERKKRLRAANQRRYGQKHRAEKNAYKRKRYAEDPEFRAKRKADAAKRYRENPEYRERILARSRARRKKLRATLGTQLPEV